MNTSYGNTGRVKIVLLVVGIIALVALGVGLYVSGNFKGDQGEGKKVSSGPEVEYYTCSMHPFIKEDSSGPCPVCGMKLQPVYANDDSVSDVPDPPGTVKVSSDEARMLGIRTVTVIRKDISASIRTVGRVVPDESRLEHVHTKVSGWIEKLYFDQTGAYVRKGEPMIEIYSPDIFSAQKEYLIALRARDELSKSSIPEATESVELLVKAARERLQLWDIPESFIEELEFVREAKRTITLEAPVSGIVLERNVTSGQQITPGFDLFVIANFDRIWVLADIFENEIPFVHKGIKVTASFAGAPDRQLKGKVSYVYPYLDETTRTNRVRIEFSNKNGALRPGMYGDVVFDVPSHNDVIAVPSDAVLVTGKRNVAFVSRGKGRYAPREVVIGRRQGGFIEIKSGLEVGEVVVDRAAFFLDSESQLRMLGSAATGHDHAAMTGEKKAKEVVAKKQGYSKRKSISLERRSPTSQPSSQPMDNSKINQEGMSHE